MNIKEKYGNNKHMIKMLIIFLFLIVLLIFIFGFIKLKVKIDIFVNNFNIGYTIKIFKKEFKGVYMLEELKKEDIKAQKVQNSSIKKKKFKRKVLNFFMMQDNKISITKMKNIMQIVEIKELLIDLKIGLLFITPTLLSVVFGSTLLSLVQALPFKEVKGVKFRVLPIMNKLALNSNIKSTVEISLYSIILLIIVTIISNKKKCKSIVQ